MGEILELTFNEILLPKINSNYSTHIVFSYYYSSRLTTSDSILIKLSTCDVNCDIGTSDSSEIADMADFTDSTGIFEKNVYKRFSVVLSSSSGNYYAKVQELELNNDINNIGNPAVEFTPINGNVFKIQFLGDAVDMQYLRLVDVEVYSLPNTRNNSYQYTGKTPAIASDCIKGTFFNSQTIACEKCFPAYDECSSSISNKPCSHLATFPHIDFSLQSEPLKTNKTCTLDYFNILALGISAPETDNQLFKIDLTPEDFPGYTIGFWLYAEELLNNPTTPTDVTIHLDDILKVKITRQSATNIKITIYHYFIEVHSENSLPINKWISIRVGISQVKDFEINHYNAFLDYNFYDYLGSDYYQYANTSQHEFATQYSNIESIMRANRSDDYTLNKKFTKIFKSGEKFIFRITRSTSDTAGELIILRNIVVFGDYLRSKIEEVDWRNNSQAYLFLPLSEVDSTKTFKFYHYGTDADVNDVNYNSITYDLEYSQPRSKNFHRLNILPENSKYKNTKFETETYTCSNSNSDTCLYFTNLFAEKNNEFSLLCKNDDSEIDYMLNHTVKDDFEGNLATPQCSTTKDGEAYMISYVSPYECDSPETLEADNKRWFEYSCIDKYFTNIRPRRDNPPLIPENIYMYGGLYYSHQIKSPDVVMNFDTQNKYLISFWFFPETNENFKIVGFSDDSDAKNYFFMTDNIRLFYRNGIVQGEVKNKTSQLFEATSNAENIVQFGRSWHNFIITSDGETTTFRHGLINEGQTLLISNSINRICLTSTTASCGFNSSDANNKWYPGFYRDFEVYSDPSLILYKGLRTVFNLYEENKYLLPDSYPINNYLVSAYRMMGWNTNFDSSIYSTTHEDFFTLRDIVPKESNNLTYEQEYSEHNRYNFSFGFETLVATVGEYFDVATDPSVDSSSSIVLDDENCLEGHSNVCFKCKQNVRTDSGMLDYALSFDQNCLPLLNENYLRSPKLTNHDMILKLEPISSTDLDYQQFMFSTYLKIVGIQQFNSSDDTTPLITVPGYFELAFSHSRKSVFILCYNNELDASDENYKVMCSNYVPFSSEEFFSRWVNFSVKLDFTILNLPVSWLYVDFIKYKFVPEGVNLSTTAFPTNNKIIIRKYLIGLVNSIYYLTEKKEPGDFNELEVYFSTIVSENAKITYSSDDEGLTNAINCDDFGFSGLDDSNCKIRQCIDSSFIHEDDEGKYMCVRDYEKVDDYCEVNFTVYISEDNELFQVQQFDYFSSPLSNLHSAYYFGLEPYEDIISGVRVVNIDSILLNKYISCVRPNSNFRNNLYKYSARYVGNKLQFAIKDVPMPFDYNYITKISMTAYSVISDITQGSLSLKIGCFNTEMPSSDPTIEIQLPNFTQNTFTKIEFKIKYIIGEGADIKIIEFNDDSSVEFNCSEEYLVFMFKSTSSDITDLRNFRLSLIEVHTDMISYMENKNFLSGNDGNCSQCQKHHSLVIAPIPGNNLCVKCFPAYSNCDSTTNTNINFYNSLRCSYLSSTPFNTDGVAVCNLDYLNLNSLTYITRLIPVDDSIDNNDPNDVVKILLKPEKAYAYTLGFWVFIEKMMNESKIIVHADEIIRVEVERPRNCQSEDQGESIQISIFYNNIPISLESGESFIYRGIRKWAHIKVGISLEHSYKIKTSDNNFNEIKNGFIEVMYYDIKNNINELVKTTNEFYFPFKEYDCNTDNTDDNEDNKILIERPLRKVFSENEDYQNRDHFVFRITRILDELDYVIVRDVVLFTNYIRTNFED